MATADQLTEYYQGVLILQYALKPKARGTVGAFVGQLIADAICLSMRDAFDLDTAVGVQLDLLGKLRGVQRKIYDFSPTVEFMALPDYDDPDKGDYRGMADYDTAPTPDWYTMFYEDVQESAIIFTLNDGDFRRLIQFMAQVHSCGYGYGELDQILYDLFGTDVDLTHDGAMALTYTILAASPHKLIFDAMDAMGWLPHPAGVAVNYEVTP
jgi:hypothetical protein